MRRRLVRRPLVELAFPKRLGSDEFEKCLKSGQLQLDAKGRFRFDMSAVEFAPLESLMAILCIVNRLADDGAHVTVEWSEEQDSFRYAERMGFFDLLHQDVDVTPVRPERGWTSFSEYQNKNPLLLEMTALPIENISAADAALARLAERLEENLSGYSGVPDAVNRVWTCASETVGNIYEHSESPVPGVIAVQRYSSSDRGHRLQLVIADAGFGLTATIRRGNPFGAGKRSDVDLMLTAFRDGISSTLERGRGCGLTKCAQVAALFSGNLRVRSGGTWAKLVTKSRKGWTVGIYDDDAVTLPGTQIVFDFYLDSPS